MSQKNLFEKYKNEICSICSKRESTECELHIKIDNSIKCDEFERVEQEPVKKKKIEFVTAKQLKSVMNKIV